MPISSRAFKTKAFARLARKAGISDEVLCRAMSQIQRGQAEDLGGGVWKKRLNDNEDRSIVLAKGGQLWIYADLFAKQDKKDLEPDELKIARQLAGEYAKLDEKKLKELLQQKRLLEICHG